MNFEMRSMMREFFPDISSHLMRTFGLLLLSLGSVLAAERVVPLETVADSRHGPGHASAMAFDGVVADDSRWISGAGPGEHWIEARFGERLTLRAADVYSGFEDAGMIENFVLRVPEGTGWTDLPGTAVIDNKKQGLRLVFPAAVTADRIRLRIPDAGGDGQARLRELILWRQGNDPLPALEKDLGKGGGNISHNPVFPRDRHLVFLNQSGFNRDWPKRFTAPLSPDGTEFTITPQSHPRPMFRGTIQGHIGDFSAFKPEDPDMSCVVRINGGTLKPGVSDPFFVAPYWMQRVSLEPALRFFVDDRSVTGTHPGAYGAVPWRDATFYGYSVPSLVHLYLAHPAFFDRQPVEMDWERDLARVLAPGFPYDPKAGENSLELLERMRAEIDGPVGGAVPDIVQLIHWGVSWWLLKPESKDYAGSEYKLHPETITVFAFFLYAHPWMAEDFTPEYYRRVSDYAFQQWEPLGLLEVNKTLGTFKGRYPPGFTVLPNLMMYEVAKREKRPGAERFLEAAVAQATWMVADLDLRDPLVTKGQRMSEHKTHHGLVALLKSYPDHAPEGLSKWMEDWADIAVLRSENLWDFRKFSAGRDWSLPRSMPGHTGGGASWNEPGNLAGFPAIAWGVGSVLGDSDDDLALRNRLHELAVSQWDVLFGRNPLGCHSAWRGPLDFAGVERGWPVKFPPHCAHLHTARGTLCSSPATEHFPFNPAGEFRHAEGWSAFNAAWNVALAESVRHDVSFAREEGVLTVRGPFFVPSIEVVVRNAAGREETMVLHATDFRQDTFTGKLAMDGPLELRYGHGFFAARTRLD
jgi:hypothetical protein